MSRNYLKTNFLKFKIFEHVRSAWQLLIDFPLQRCFPVPDERSKKVQVKVSILNIKRLQYSFNENENTIIRDAMIPNPARICKFRFELDNSRQALVRKSENEIIGGWKVKTV